MVGKKRDLILKQDHNKTEKYLPDRQRTFKPYWKYGQWFKAWHLFIYIYVPKKSQIYTPYINLYKDIPWTIKFYCLLLPPEIRLDRFFDTLLKLVKMENNLTEFSRNNKKNMQLKLKFWPYDLNFFVRFGAGIHSTLMYFCSIKGLEVSDAKVRIRNAWVPS